MMADDASCHLLADGCECWEVLPFFSSDCRQVDGGERPGGQRDFPSIFILPPIHQ